MKILLTGAKGQLGNELNVLSQEYPNYTFLFTDLPELDITNATAIDNCFTSFKPDVLINCAAYTAVDKAETDTETAFLVNATASGLLAQCCAKYGTYMVHISTDYVYGGNSFIPLIETDPLNPVSQYAKSKLEGENQVLHYASKGIIFRTSWLYSAFGHNFVKTMMKYGRERGLLNVVFDQIGTPTYAYDLAKLILNLLPVLVKKKGIDIYHYSNEGVCSWYDFAKAIIEIAGIDCTINAIGTADYPTPASRPFYSVLDKSKLKKEFGVSIPYWRDSLKQCILRLE